MTVQRDNKNRLVLAPFSDENADWLKLLDDGKEQKADLAASDDALARWRERHARTDSNQKPDTGSD